MTTAVRVKLGVTLLNSWADACPCTHRPWQAEVGTVPVVQRPPHRFWHDLKVSTGNQLQGALDSTTFHCERRGLEDQKEKKKLFTIHTRNHPSAWITCNRQKAHLGSMRKHVVIRINCRDKDKETGNTICSLRALAVSWRAVFFPP